MVSATPLFAAPTGLTAETGDGQVKLIWSDPGNSTITGYELSIDGGAFAEIVGSDAATTSHTATGLINGRSYTFAVRAVNGAAAMVDATPTPLAAPAKPTTLAAAPGDGQVTLSWDDPLNNSISSYELSIDGGAFAEIVGSDASTTGYTVDNLSNGTAYSFAVRAVNASGEGASSDTLSATPLFAAPTGLTAEAGDGWVKLIWSDPGNSTITGYELSMDGGAFAEIVGSDAATTSHTATGLINGRSYTFAVRAVNGAAAMVDATPTPLAKLIVSFGASNYEATEGGKDARVTVSLSALADRTLTIPITTEPTSGDFALSETSLSFAMGDQKKIITVNARDDADLDDEQVVLGFGTLPEYVGEGSQSTTTVKLKDKGQEEAPPPPPSPPVPGRPGNLTAAPDDRAIALSWTAAANNGSPITKYQHRRSDAGWEDVPGGPTATKVTVSGLTNGVEYVFYVRAVSSAGAGAQASVSATPAAAPDAPGNLIATPDDGAVALSWTAAANNGMPITKYQHRRSDVGWEDLPGGPTATEVTVSGLTNGVEYVFYVRAVSSAGTGAQASVSATPAAAPDAPGNLTATPDDGAVALSWTPAEDNGSPIKKYQHQRDDAPLADIAGGATANSLTVTGLVNGTRYTFSVRAVNGMGEGAVASVTAAPQADPADSEPGETPVPTPEPPPTPEPETTDEPTPTPTATPMPTQQVVLATPMPTQQVVLATPMPTQQVVLATPEPTQQVVLATPEPTQQVVLATPEPTQQVVLAAPEPTQQVVLATPTPEPTRTPVLTATMVPRSAGGAVAAPPTAAPVAGPTPQPTATQMPALRVRVTPTATIEPAARPTATPADTPLKEVPSQITASPLVPVGIGLFSLLIAALAAFLLTSRLRR